MNCLWEPTVKGCTPASGYVGIRAKAYNLNATDISKNVSDSWLREDIATLKQFALFMSLSA